MKDIEIFLERLNKLTNELDALGQEFADLYKQYDGSDFENQHYLATTKLDDSIHVATHEMASTIGFMGIDMKELTDFIDFRKTFFQFTDDELEKIIDNQTIAVEQKLDLAKRLTNGDVKLLLNKIQHIQQGWSEKFMNTSYKKIKNKFSIDNDSAE